MAGYKWRDFGGMRPLASVLRLRPNEARSAGGVDLHRGCIRPRDVQQAWHSTLHPSLERADSGDAPASLFRFLDRVNSDEFWMYWETDVDVASGNVENPEQRHYYTGDGAPKMFTADSIDDSTPPYPQPADDKYPFTWFFLGVPAPADAPTIDADSYVPPDTAKSGVITGLEVPNLVIRFNPARPRRGVDITKSNRNGLSTEVSGETHMDSDSGAMLFEVMKRGLRVKVTEIVGANQVRVAGTFGRGYLEDFPSTNYDEVVPENLMDTRWKWDPDEISPNTTEEQLLYRRINGKSNDIAWAYHVPDGAVLNIASHALRVDDIIRVVAVTEPMTWSSPTRLRAGPPIRFPGAPGRERELFDPGEMTIEFSGELTFFVERDGREFDPTIEDVVVDAREPTTRSYVYTYMTALGEEGPPCEPTTPFTIALGDSVVVKDFTAPPTEHREITKYLLYRTNTGTQETAFQLVDEILVATYNNMVGYLDEKTDDELGEVLQSETWAPPPEDMIGIVAMPNQFLAGFYDNVLCFSEPGFPHAWPVEYRMHLEHKIIAIKVIGGTLIVATRGTPYVVAGTHPRQMAARREEEPAPCVDKRSMVDCGDAAVYASTDGLIVASPSGFRNATLEYYTREQWVAQVVGPPQKTEFYARAWFKDGEYLLFSRYETPGAVDPVIASTERVFDFRDPEKLGITNAEIAVPRAAFTDPTDSELYYVPSAGDALNLIYETALSGDDLPILRWRYLYPTVPPEPYDSTLHGALGVYSSGIVMLPRPMAISCVQVICRRFYSAVGAHKSFGRLAFSLSGYRYDSANTATDLEENDHGTELAFVTLIEGDVDAVDFAGEQRSMPFRVDQNVLVDALSFDVSMRGYVEVEAVLVGESFDDLVRLAAV